MNGGQVEASERITIAFGLAACLLVLVCMMSGRGVNHDSFHVMSLARESLALGAIPDKDLYSYAPTVAPPVEHEWLSGVVDWAAWKALGLGGFTLIWFSFAAGYAALCWGALRRLDAPLALACGLPAMPLVGYSLFQPLTPQAWSVLCCALFLLALKGGALQRRRQAAALLAVFILWANLHGGVTLAFAILAAYGLERWLEDRSWRAAAALLAVMALALAVNPWGWHYHEYLLRAIPMKRPNIGQWQPDWMLHWENYRFSVPFLPLLALLAHAGWRRRGRFEGFLVSALLAALSVRAHKVLPFFAFAWVLFVPSALAATPLAERWARLWRRAPALPGAVFLLVCAAAATIISFQKPWAVCIPEDPALGLTQPVKAADYLERTGATGNMLTFFRNGAYISWRLYPKVKVSCDGRYEVAYPPADVERNFSLYEKAPEQIGSELARLPATTLILADQRHALAAELPRLSGWHLEYSGGGFVLYGRNR